MAIRNEWSRRTFFRGPIKHFGSRAEGAETQMLRTLFIASVLILPGAAAAEQFPRAASEQVVRGHDGAVVGRVGEVEYDEDGNIIAAEIAGLEPADAPYAPSNLIAEERLRVPTRAPAANPAAARLQEARASGRVIRAR